MELNHEYQNMYIRGIIQAVNAAVVRGGIGTDAFEEIVYRTAGDRSGKVGLDFLYDFLESEFFDHSVRNTVKPKLPVQISLLPTGAELEWLLHALRTPMAALFLDTDTRTKLLAALEAAEVPDLMRHIRHYGYAEPELPDAGIFGTLLDAIRTHRTVYLTNRTRDGREFRDMHVIPMKLEYSAQTGRWFLSFCPADGSRPIKANLRALRDVKAGEPVPEGMRPKLREMMQAKRAEPLVLRIYREKNTQARALAFFSQYDAEAVQEADGTLRMEIQHYVFDREMLLRQIIGFGPYIQVLAPESAVEWVRSYLRALPY